MVFRPALLAANKLFLFLIALYAVSSFGDENQCPLCGIWKSNAELTLKNLHNADPPLAKRAIEILEKKIEWGRLRVEYTATDARFWIEGEETTETDQWTAYEIVSSSGDEVVVHTTFQDKVKMLTITIQDNCYSLPVWSFGFDEVFCRVAQ